MAPLIHAFCALDKKYVYDANANSIIPLDNEEWEVAKLIEQGICSSETEELISRYNKHGYFFSPDIKEIEHPDTEIMKYHLTRKISKLTLQVTQRCNLRCSYCVYSGDGTYDSRSHSNKTMTFETAKKAIDYVLQSSIDSNLVNFSFYGGEPLLELDLILECIDYVKARRGAKRVTFNLTTNGTLLTIEIYKVLSDYDVSILVSLDGPKPVHDNTRKYIDGGGSYDDIMRNVNAIRSIFPDANKRLSFLAVASPYINDSCLDDLYSLDDVMPYYDISLSFMTDTYTDVNISYTDQFFSIYIQERTKLFLYMLGKLDKEKVARLMLDGEDRLRLKFRDLRPIKALPEKCHHGGPCLAGVHRLFLSVDGVYYSCERVSEDSNVMQIGTVEDGIDIEKATNLINVGKVTEEECKNCWAILHCTMCAAHADDMSCLSKEVKLRRCKSVKAQVEDIFKEVCFLKANNYNFLDKF
ncbi:MAG: Cys-rich peptide radical SAM maturase CcpM [Oscillospiraceae bacterium]|nr:Cys-rich peptide radical SAM maturase CcpM [Oscillospiraceae bacterium]MCL2279613.1 Cys-rich peptide radical SAM maturase CcpM [Oscillospiraceae bacterium]